jgi:hypothetical protein
MPLYTVPSTAVYRAADGDTRSFTAGTVISMDDAVEFGMPGASSLSAVSGSVNQRLQTVAMTATTDGLGNGTIPDGTDYAVVTSANANNIIILPTPTPGTTVGLANGATGYELRSSAPTTIAINGGSGAAAESAIPANTLVICVCRTATAWLCSNTSTAGAVTATEVAAP